MQSIPPPVPAQDRLVVITANVVDSVALFGPARELLIRHNDATYRLRLTAQNKIILTK